LQANKESRKTLLVVLTGLQAVRTPLACRRWLWSFLS